MHVYWPGVIRLFQFLSPVTRNRLAENERAVRFEIIHMQWCILITG